MSASPLVLDFGSDLGAIGMPAAAFAPMLTDGGATIQDGQRVSLPAYATFVGEVIASRRHP
ncbi:MAG: hypothetical protein NTY02_08540 [Acidobacteria bacterium]|nr:hypothetical protein [Acidobacteriota bacterium]